MWLAITPFFILKALKTEKSRNWLRSIVQHLFRLICVGHNENYFVTSNSVAPLKVDFTLFLSKNTFKQCSDIGKKENFLSHLAKLRVVLPVGRSQMLNDVRRRKWAVPNLAKTRHCCQPLPWCHKVLRQRVVLLFSLPYTHHFSLIDDLKEASLYEIHIV